MLDLRVFLDDVPFGLTLQKHTPFRFLCNRLWMKHIPEVAIPLRRLDKAIDLKVGFNIAHIIKVGEWQQTCFKEEMVL